MRIEKVYEIANEKIKIIEENGKIIEINFVSTENVLQTDNSSEDETMLMQEAKKQLDEYFLGNRKEFNLPLNPKGTAFQQKVWEALQTIPYGETRSYQEIAIQIGSPKAIRAVGMANHCNPIGIVIPCHRVIGKNGKLTGYAGGLSIKEKLLKLEKENK